MFKRSGLWRRVVRVLLERVGVEDETIKDDVLSRV
jgi:hypothetical protein